MQLLHGSIVKMFIVQSQHFPKCSQQGANESANIFEEKDIDMAYASSTQVIGFAIGNRIASLRSRIADALARRKVYRTTLAELNSLTSRDLADLGLNRSMVQSVAFQAAYENE